MNMRAWFRSTATMAIVAGLTLSSAQAQLKDLVAEETVPAETSMALRDRVTQFFGYHVGTANRRAMDMVAEDTQDFYYQSQKMQFKDFKIEKIEFTRDQTRANVSVRATRNWDIQSQPTLVDTPIATTWRIEDGKWVWYLDAKDVSTTPMGMSDFLGATAAAKNPTGGLFELNPDGTPKIPADFSSPDRLMAQTQKILKQSGLDKSEVVLTFGEAATNQFTFQNGFTGDVLLELAGSPSLPGLKVFVEKANLRAQENGIIRVQYEPPSADAKDFVEPQTYSLNLVLEPFNQIFPIKVTVRPPAAK